MTTIAIIGAGLAGVTAANAAREAGFTGRLLLIEAEDVEPYDRPPLSKEVLVRPGSETSAALRPVHWYAEKGVELLRGAAASHLDVRAREIALSNGSSLHYDKLLLAMGSRARRFPGLEEGPLPCLYLRTLADALALRLRLAAPTRLAIIGAGVIGMEVAASAIQCGCKVSVIEQADYPMSRVLSASRAAHVARYHLNRGVEFFLGARVRGSATVNGTTGVQLENGAFVPADAILVGIGVLPNTEVAALANIACNDGVVVDDYGATSDSDVFAAGDVAWYRDSFLQKSLRGESWMHAQKHAAQVARNMLGERLPYRQVPSMWSDQYDLKIQVIGAPAAESTITRGDVEANAFVDFHLQAGRLVGATGINQPKDMAVVHRLIEGAAIIDPKYLRDPNFKLRSALRN